MGVAIIFSLSYNMLLGQSGMLSFGHAVYSGLGAFIAVHTLNMASKGQLWMPVSLLPLVGGLAGAFFGVLFGYVTTKQRRHHFRHDHAGHRRTRLFLLADVPGFFRRRRRRQHQPRVRPALLRPHLRPLGAGLLPDRAVVPRLDGAMYAWSHTPLGRMANAVRDNPERAEFVGYDTQKVRWLTLIISAFFAGIAGALAAASISRSSRRKTSVRSAPAACCSRRSSAASASSSGRSSAPACSSASLVALSGPDPCLAAVPGPVLHADRDVRARRHGEPAR